MKWGIALNVRDTISKTVEKSVIADKGGIDQVWVTDFPALRYAPMVATAVAEKTEHCRIGVGLISPLLYSSSNIVQFMTTLVESHGNRFDLLLGPGDRFALESIGVSYSMKDSLRITKESLAVIKNELDEAGTECSVLLGAQGPKMIESSLSADGVLLNYTDLEMAKWAKDQLGNDIGDKFRVGLFPPAFVGQCERFMGNLAISYSAAMVALGLGKSVAKMFEIDVELESARKLLKTHGKISDEVVSSIKEDLLKRFAFCGTPEELLAYVIGLDEIGYTSVVFGPPAGLSKKSLNNLILARNSY